MSIKMKLSKRKLFFIVITIVAILALFTGFILWNQKNSEDDFGNKDKVGQTYLKSSFGDGNFIYSCSKEIEVVYRGSSLGPGAVYSPLDQQEFNKYCRSDAAIEYVSVIDILKREDVSSAIKKYDTSQAWVRALGHEYIDDKEYIKRILPAYSDTKIDCIIVVHSPEGTRFFIENGEKHHTHADHHYMEPSSEDFLESLNSSSDEDINNFWLGLH